MTDAWRFALDRFGSEAKWPIRALQDERFALLGQRHQRILEDLIEVIYTAAEEAFASPYGEDRIDNDRVQASNTPSGGRRIANAATFKELNASMDALDNERMRLRLVVHLDDPPDRKRGPYHRRQRRSC